MPWYRMRMDRGGHPDAFYHLNMKNSPRPCSICFDIGGRLCDWNLPSGKDCDRSICEHCSTEPAKDKDLCPEHALAYKAWLAARTNSTDGDGF